VETGGEKQSGGTVGQEAILNVQSGIYMLSNVLPSIGSHFMFYPPYFT